MCIIVDVANVAALRAHCLIKGSRRESGTGSCIACCEDPAKCLLLTLIAIALG